MASLKITIALTSMAVLSLPAMAQSSDAEAFLRAVVECRTIEDNAARLACFDRTSATLETNLDTGAVVAMSREDVDTAERDSFGLELPNFGALARSLVSREDNAALAVQDPAPSRDQIEEQPPAESPRSQPTSREQVLANADAQAAERSGVVVEERDREGRAVVVVMEIERFEEFGYNQGRFHMSNGQVWQQTHAQRVRMPTRLDAYAHIRRTATGIHLLRVNDRGTAVKVRRIR